jgi:O-antigen ligase
MEKISFNHEAIIIRIIVLIFIFAFIGWISLFGEAVQAKYYDFTFWGLVIFFTISCLYKKISRLFAIDLFFFLYIFILTFGLNFSQDKFSAIERYTISVMPIPFLYFSLRFQNMRTIFFTSLIIFLFSNLVVISGILEVIYGENIIYELWIKNPFYHRFIHQTPRIMSTLMHPTIFGSFILGSLPFSFFLHSHTRPPFKILVEISIPILILGIVFSFSRGNVFGLFVSTLTFLYLKRRVRYIKFMIIAFLILLILASSALKRDFSFFRLSLSGFCGQWWQTKTEMANITVKILKEHPFLGVGLNHFRLKFDIYSSENFKSIERHIRKAGGDPYEWKTPDNMYLLILSETGLLGFLSFILFLLFLIKRALAFLNITDDAMAGDFTITLLSGIVGLLISMNTYDLFYWINPLLLFWFLAGTLSAFLITSEEKNNPLCSHYNFH